MSNADSSGKGRASRKYEDASPGQPNPEELSHITPPVRSSARISVAGGLNTSSHTGSPLRRSEVASAKPMPTVSQNANSTQIRKEGADQMPLPGYPGYPQRQSTLTPAPVGTSNVDSLLQAANAATNAGRLFREELELEEEAEEELEAAVEDVLERSREKGDEVPRLRQLTWRVSSGPEDLGASKHQTDFTAHLPLRRKEVIRSRSTKVQTTRLPTTGETPTTNEVSFHFAPDIFAEKSDDGSPPVRFNDLSASVEIGVMKALTKRDDFTGPGSRGSCYDTGISDSGKQTPVMVRQQRSLLPSWPWVATAESKRLPKCNICSKHAPWRMPACFLNWVDRGAVQFHHPGFPFDRDAEGCIVLTAGGIALHRWLCATQKIVDLRWLRQKPGRRSLLLQEIHWSKENDEREDKRRQKSMYRKGKAGFPVQDGEPIPNPLHVDLKHLDGTIKHRMMACQFVSWSPQLKPEPVVEKSRKHTLPKIPFQRNNGNKAPLRDSVKSNQSKAGSKGMRYACELCGYRAPPVQSNDSTVIAEAQRMALADHMQSHAGSWLILYEIVARKCEFDDTITGDTADEFECRWILYDYDPISGMEKIHSRRWLQVHAGRALKSDNTCPWSCTKISSDGNYIASVEVSCEEYEPFRSQKEFEHFRKQVRQGTAQVASDVSIYDANSGLRLGIVGAGLFKEGTMTIRCLRWLPNMRGLVVGTDDGLLVLLHLHPKGLDSPEFMSLSYEEKVRVISSTDASQCISKTVHARHDQPEKRAIVEIAISHDGRLLASGGKDMRFFVYEVCERLDGSIDLKVRWSHSNKMGRIYTMDWRPQPMLVEEDNRAKGATHSRQPYQLAVGSDDNYLRVYEIPYVDTIEEIEYVEEVTNLASRKSRAARDLSVSNFDDPDGLESNTLSDYDEEKPRTIQISYLSRKEEGAAGGTQEFSLPVYRGETVWSIKSKTCDEIYKLTGTKPDPSALLMTCSSVQLEDTLRASVDFDLSGKFAAMKRRQVRFITPMYDSMDDSDYFQDYLRAVRYTKNGLYLIAASGHKGPGKLLVFNAEAMEPIQSYQLQGKVNPQGIQVGVIHDTVRHGSSPKVHRSRAAKERSVFLVAGLQGSDVTEVCKVSIFNALNSASTEPMVPLHSVHRTGIKCVVFSNSGSVIACGSEGGSVSVFNVNSHELIKKYTVGVPGGGAPVVAMQFSKSEDRLIVACSGSGGGYFRLVDLFPRVTLADIKRAFFAPENHPVLETRGKHTFVNALKRVELLHYAMLVESAGVAARRTSEWGPRSRNQSQRRGKVFANLPFGESWRYTDDLKRDLLCTSEGKPWKELAEFMSEDMTDDLIHIVNKTSTANHVRLDCIAAVHFVDVEEALSHASHANNVCAQIVHRRSSQEYMRRARQAGVLIEMPRIPGMASSIEDNFPKPWENDQVQLTGQIPDLPRISTFVVSSKGHVIIGGHPRIKGGPPILLLPSEESITCTAGLPYASETQIVGQSICLPPPPRDKGGGAGAVHCAAFSDDGEFFVCGTETGGVFMISIDEFEEPVWHKYVHKKAVFSIAYTAAHDGRVASGGRDKLIIIYSAFDGQEIQRIPEDHQGWVNALTFLPRGDLVSGSQDRTLRAYQEKTNYAVKDFQRRLYTFLDNGGVNCIAHAPFNRGYDGLVAIGMADGKVQFVDLSMHHHQPTFHEAHQTIEYDKMMGNEDFVLTKEMVTRFPYVIFASNYDGTTLLHVAAGASEAAGQEGRSMSTLLTILLNAKTPKFWLPMDHVGQDPLRIAASVKMDRTAVQIILEHAILTKNEKGGSRLSPAFSTLNNNLLVNLISLSMHYPDLVGRFLDDYGVDKAELSFEKSEHERRQIHSILKNTGYRFQAEEQLFFGPESSLLGGDSEGLVVGREAKRMRAVDWPMELQKMVESRIFKNSHADDYKSHHTPRMTLVPMFIGIPLVAGTLPLDVCERISPGVAHSSESQIRMSMLHSFVMANDPALFGSQIMRTVVQYKWETFAKREFYQEFFAHVVFVIMFTWMSTLSANDRAWNHSTNGWDMFSGVAAGFILLYCTKQLLSELRQARRSRQGSEQSLRIVVFRYSSDPWNVIQTLSYTLSICAASMHLACGLYDNAHETLWNAKDILGAIAGFLNWSSILYYLRPLQMFRGLVRTISLVIWRSLKFVAIYLIVLAGATNCMFLLYRNFSCTNNEEAVSCATYPHRGCNETGGFVFSDSTHRWVEYDDNTPVILNSDGEVPPSCSAQYFSPNRSFWSTFFHTITVYVMGDIEQFVAQQDAWDEHNRVYSATSIIARIIFLIFLFTLNIFMLNLMINLMDDILAQIHMEEGNAFNAERARVISEIEMKMSVDFVKQENFFPRWLHSLTMKRENANAANSRWGGHVKAIQDSNSDLYKGLSRQQLESAEESRRAVRTLSKKLDTLEGELRRTTRVLEHIVNDRLPPGPRSSRVNRPGSVRPSSTHP